MRAPTRARSTTARPASAPSPISAVELRGTEAKIERRARPLSRRGAGGERPHRRPRADGRARPPGPAAAHPRRHGQGAGGNLGRRAAGRCRTYRPPAEAGYQDRAVGQLVRPVGASRRRRRGVRQAAQGGGREHLALGRVEGSCSTARTPCPAPTSPAEFAAFVKAEQAKWGPVVAATGASSNEGGRSDGEFFHPRHRTARHPLSHRPGRHELGVVQRRARARGVAGRRARRDRRRADVSGRAAGRDPHRQGSGPTSRSPSTCRSTIRAPRRSSTSCSRSACRS